MLLEERPGVTSSRSNVEANEFHIPSLNSATGGPKAGEGEAGWRIVSHLKERGRGGRLGGGKGGTLGGKGPPTAKPLRSRLHTDQMARITPASPRESDHHKSGS